MSASIEDYESAVGAARLAVENNESLREILSEGCEQKLFALWMLRYSVHGVHMTKPVEGWISTAGENCSNLGLDDLGKALRAHARAESGHEQMMIIDARYLAADWNSTAASPIDVEALLDAQPLASTVDYILLHQEIINGDRPFGQVAIEYEIERLSTVLGPAILTQAQRLIGPDGRGYSFIADHVELDQGHTTFNRRQLSGVIDGRPDIVDFLAGTGGRALATYTAFMAECLELARGDLAAEATAARTAPAPAALSAPHPA